MTITLQGKLLYGNACEEKSAWDALCASRTTVPEVGALFTTWSFLPQSTTQCPRINLEISLHAFKATRGKGVAPAVYAIVEQPSTLNQGLFMAKARLSKQGLTIFQRELVLGHISVNLLSNVQDEIQGFPVTSLHCWLDSSIALHRIVVGGDYKQFVANQVRKDQRACWGYLAAHTIWR